MGQQNVSDELLLQQASGSASRLLEHLSQHAAGHEGEGTGMNPANAGPSSELESAVASLRQLIIAMHKELQRR